MILVVQQSYAELRALPGLVAELAGYSVGVVLSLLLLRLVARSPEPRKLPQSLLGVGALAWNLGGLLKFSVLLGTWHQTTGLINITNAVVFSIAGFWPAAAIAVWIENSSPSESGRKPGRFLLAVSVVSGALIAAAQLAQLWTAFRPLQSAVRQRLLQSEFVRESVAYNAFCVIGAGAWFLLRRQGLTRLQKLSVAVILAGIAVNIASVAAHSYFRLPASMGQLALVLKHQSIILVVIGSLFYLARFRSLDVFVKLSLRILAAAAIAVAASCLALVAVRAMATETVAPDAFAVVAVAVLTALAALLLHAVSPKIDAFVERQIFCKPDYRLGAKQLRQQLAALETRAEVVVATERFVRDTLELRMAQILTDAYLDEERSGPADNRSRSGAGTTNRGSDIVVPIIVSDRPEYFLQLVRRDEQPMLLTVDLEFAQEAAEIAGRRLEALDRETERIERARHESELVRQLVSAELRALRAQVNPHFLFNALNTIAALIPPEPAKAELMTVRLAKVFRHVLTHADRSFSPVEEEMEFLRTYLEIEQVRFGDRLTVRFEVAERAAGTIVPSLILQPLVENALKHGLAPKLGNTELVIRASLAGDSLLISIEDNGVGPRNANNRKALSTGLGLRNVQERLHTIYGGRATLALEAGPLGGSRAILQIPAAGVTA